MTSASPAPISAVPAPQAIPVYSARLGAISDEQFQRCLTRLGLGTFVAAERVTSGICGQNVFITSTRGEYVMRGFPLDDAQLAREAFMARHIHDQTTVAGPWPYRIDSSTDIFGWPYALMRRLPGRRIESPFKETLTLEDRRSMARAFGSVLAQLRTVRLPACGEYDPQTDAIRPNPEGWKGHLRSVMDRHLCKAAQCSPNTVSADRLYVADMVERGMAALDVPCDYTICSSDFGENNAVVLPHGGSWAVAGIFDLHEWFAGDAEYSISRQVMQYNDEHPQLAYDFIAAYAQGQPLRPGFAERAILYVICDRFIFWNFGHDRQWFDPTHEFVRFAGPSIQKLRETFAALAAHGLLTDV